MERPNSHSETQGSPDIPHKKSRGKYASKACVECRNRKLKCDGRSPCARCTRRNHHCLYSDDRAVAEVLRRSRQELANGSMNGNHSLEARMESLEMKLQALTERLDGEDTSKSNYEQEVTERPGFQGDTSFQSPIDTFNASLVQVKQQLGFRADQNGTSASPASTKLSQRPSEATLSSLRREQSYGGSEIRIGSRTLPFPSPHEYRRYLDFFFNDINACHPCINEGDFRVRSEKMLANQQLQRNESCFLALHYIVFACCDILQDFTPPEETRYSPGWMWYNAADELVGRTKFNGQGDLSLIQFLIFEAFYLVHEDKPNAAYNISGLACRLCFQFGLHQQSRWEEADDSYYAHMKQRILWTAYFADRRIALSCGRPYGISDRDIDVELPAWLSDQEISPDQPLPNQNLNESYLMYLSCMVSFAKFGGEIWDNMFSAGASKTVPNAETIAVLDVKIKHWAETNLPMIPLLPPNNQTLRRHLRQHILVHTRVCHLRLLLRRRLMVSLTYSAQDGRLCGELAMEIVQLITRHSDEASEPSSFRFHMAVSLGGALVILGTLLCRPLIDLGLQDLYPAYSDAFRQGHSLLKELASGLFAARRMLLDLKDIIQVVTAIVEQPVAAPQQQPQLQMPANIDNLFPYGAIDFAQQGGYPYETYQPGNFSQGMAYNNFEQGWNGDALQMQTANHGYGVPWI